MPRGVEALAWAVPGQGSGPGTLWPSPRRNCARARRSAPTLTPPAHNTHLPVRTSHLNPHQPPAPPPTPAVSNTVAAFDHPTVTRFRSSPSRRRLPPQPTQTSLGPVPSPLPLPLPLPLPCARRPVRPISAPPSCCACQIKSQPEQPSVSSTNACRCPYQPHQSPATRPAVTLSPACPPRPRGLSELQPTTFQKNSPL